MAETKSSLLGSISPWNISRSSTPTPQSTKPKPSEPAKDEVLRQSSGLDHAISLRPSPSLRRYPRDCPPLKARWFYAVDVAKRKPFSNETAAEEQLRPPPAPKKLVPFSAKDSQAIESAFQSLDPGQKSIDDQDSSAKTTTTTKVPVNEDYLFDVHIEKRELEPAYWLGPIYEVRRGSWFYQEGSTLRPCDENLANQIEEGYLKTVPWKKVSPGTVRSASQPRSRPASTLLDGVASTLKPSTPKVRAQDENGQPKTSADSAPSSHRLFGAHMNTTVTYQDASVAYLTADDFMSRMSSSVYGTFGSLGGTKVVRGYTESGKTSEIKTTEPTTPKEVKPKSNNASSTPDRSSEARPEGRPKRTALERQLSSLAGLQEPQDSAAQDAEDAREEEEKEMVDARDTEGEDQERPIDHLVLVTHGIGQRLGLRLDSINFVHDVNTMRKSMKLVYNSSPDLQALNDSDKTNCRIQVLPVCWRHLLDFPKQGVRQNRKEYDLGDADSSIEDEYPSLQDITVEGIPYVRALTSDLILDVLLYQSKYREYIALIVQKEMNRVLKLFKERTSFTGKVSICGHSLGSAILFDILCRQREETKVRRRISSRASRESEYESQNELRLDFDCENFFALGSPIALFQMLKGRTIVGRSATKSDWPLESPFDPDHLDDDPFSSKGLGSHYSASVASSSPKCAEFFNIFHPTDPVAYRIEPLISSEMARMKPQQLPYTKKSMFGAPGIANISARVGQQVMSSWYNLTSGVASSLINRSLGITGEEQVLPQDKVRINSGLSAPPNEPARLAPAINLPTMDPSRKQQVADHVKTSSSSPDPHEAPTLIDSELETLFDGFQKAKLSGTEATNTPVPGTPRVLGEDERAAQDEQAKKMKREEAKVKALNSNGRVDYSIQEGTFDISLLASIASHLGYWADEDVNHFMLGQMLKRGVNGGSGGGGRKGSGKGSDSGSG